MKKAVLFALIALLGGLALGTLFGSGISSASLNSVRATAAEYPAVSALDAIEVEGRSTLYPAAPGRRRHLLPVRPCRTGSRRAEGERL